MKVPNKAQMDKLSQSANVFLKINEGETRLRIVSPVYAVFEHRIEVEGKLRMPACPTETTRKAIEIGENQTTDIPPCPLCERGYAPKVAYLAFAVNRNAKKGELVAGVLKKGKQIFGAIQTLVDDPDWGSASEYDIKIVAKGEGKARKYEVVGVPASKSKPLTTEEENAVAKLATEADLEKMTTPRSYSELMEIIGEDFPNAPEDGEDEAF